MQILKAIFSNDLIIELARLVGYLLLMLAIVFRDYLNSFIKYRVMEWTDPIKFRMSQSREINDHLIGLRQSVGAARVDFCEFHNGGEFSRLARIWRLTCLYVAPRPGLAEMRDDLYHLVVEHLWEVLEPAFYEKNEAANPLVKEYIFPVEANEKKYKRGVYVIDVELLPGGHCRSLFKRRGTKLVYIVGLYVKPNCPPVGCILIEYDGILPSYPLDESVAKRIRDAAGVISFQVLKNA